MHWRYVQRCEVEVTLLLCTHTHSLSHALMRCPLIRCAWLDSHFVADWLNLAIVQGMKASHADLHALAKLAAAHHAATLSMLLHLLQVACRIAMC
jgi:hypothetical protein